VSTAGSRDDAVSRLLAQADGVGRLAQNRGGFAAVFAAVESRDPDAFRWVLERLELLPQCELICDWVRTKLCVLRCVALCGPPRERTAHPDLRASARAVVQLTSNEKALRRAVDAVACGDADAYRDTLTELKLVEFCHLLCYWICSFVYRRVCEVVCAGPTGPLPDAVSEIRDAGGVIAGLLAHERGFEAIAKAAADLDCEPLRAAIERANLTRGCEIICKLVCVWRCVWACLELCELPAPVPFAGAYAVEEARDFAQQARQFVGQTRALADLVSAVRSRDAKTFRAIVTRFGLGPYCVQACAWVCSEVCHEVCVCVCPPAELLPVFTAIGVYQYETQIDSDLAATGLTVGDTRAFYNTMRLNGILTQTLGGQPMEYRFEYQPVAIASTTLGAAISASQTSLTVASSAGFPSTPFNVSVGSANGGYEIMTVTGVSATTWTVVRAQQGTTASPAAAGAILVTGASASGPWTPVFPSQIARTVIGTWEHYTGGLPPIETKVFTVNGTPGPGELVTTISADGWIQVPQMNDVFSSSGAFSPNGNMIELISEGLAPWPAADETGVAAGGPVNHPLPTDMYFGIRMRVRQQGVPSSETDGGTCSVVAINNTLYDHVSHHLEWDGGTFSGQLAVASVDIQELRTDGCADITNSLTVLFTASHPNLGPVGVTMTGPGGPYNFTLPTPVPETGDWYGTATPSGWTLSSLTPCAYIVTLSVTPLLTTGDAEPTPLYDQIAFCLTG
jgi:hypothetical protein